MSPLVELDRFWITGPVGYTTYTLSVPLCVCVSVCVLNWWTSKGPRSSCSNQRLCCGTHMPTMGGTPACQAKGKSCMCPSSGTLHTTLQPTTSHPPAPHNSSGKPIQIGSERWTYGSLRSAVIWRVLSGWKKVVGGGQAQTTLQRKVQARVWKSHFVHVTYSVNLIKMHLK